MRLPDITGIIKRRILVNYRVAPSVIAPLLPAPFRPRLHRGHAIAGICLIRLEKIRPQGLPGLIGISSENVAHRIAVEWDEGAAVRDGVFVLRRDTDSLLNHYAGGRIFPGVHQFANFAVRDAGGHVGLRARTEAGIALVELRGRETDAFPADSVFSSLEESSRFFETGCHGYSLCATGELEGLKLITREWRTRSFAVEICRSKFFADQSVFPEGSIFLDHALIMRDIEHDWQQCPVPSGMVKRIQDGQ